MLMLGWQRVAILNVPPIPKAGPLAQPKSIHQVGVPAAATRAAIPPDNPQTPEKIALGQKLFFDGRLSADGTVACSTCHDPARAFTDGRPTSVGINGRIGQRNAPTILNALYNKTQFWDGRVKTLDEQAALPIVNPIEMGQPSMDAAVTGIAANAEYQDAFRGVFGHPPNGPDLVRAIASYERTQVSFDSPGDEVIEGRIKRNLRSLVGRDGTHQVGAVGRVAEDAPKGVLVFRYGRDSGHGSVHARLAHLNR